MMGFSVLLRDGMMSMPNRLRVALIESFLRLLILSNMPFLCLMTKMLSIQIVSVCGFDLTHCFDSATLCISDMIRQYTHWKPEKLISIMGLTDYHTG